MTTQKYMPMPLLSRSKGLPAVRPEKGNTRADQSPMKDQESSSAATDDRLHDLNTIAQRLNVTTKTVRRLIIRGDLGYHQIGRLKRVSDGQYREYLARVRRRHYCR